MCDPILNYHFVSILKLQKKNPEKSTNYNLYDRSAKIEI